MFELTHSYVKNVQLEELATLDLSEFIKLPTTEEIKLWEVSEEKKALLSAKIDAFEMKGGDEAEMPTGRETLTDTGDGDLEVKEYISINILREKIEEKGIRTIDEGFTFGKKAWVMVIEYLGLGYNDHGTYVFYDDVDPCYMAYHPKSGQLGFNVLCFNKFWDEEMTGILRVKGIVDAYLEEERLASVAATKEANKRKTLMRKHLRGV